MGTVPVTYEQEFLECRDLMHSWDKKNVLITQPRTGILHRTITCSHCGKVKHQSLNSKSFEVLSTSYDPQSGYKLERGTTKSDVRREILRRQLGTTPKQRKPKQSKRVYR